MSRRPAPPGPPPPHYRPPGAAPSRSLPLPGQPLGRAEDHGGASPPPRDGLGAGPVTAIAVVTLLVGAVIGFFAGRAVEADDEPSAAPPLTSPSTSSTTRPPGDTIPQGPPADPDAPPSTDLDPTTIGTLEDPVPAGQAYILGLYEIEVVGVDRDATQTLAEADELNPPPPEGRQHLLVEVAVRYTESAGVGNPASVPFFVTDGTSNWHDYEASCGIVPDAIIRAGLIEEGDEARGNACFTVPIDAMEDLVLATEGFSGPVYFALP